MLYPLEFGDDPQFPQAKDFAVVPCGDSVGQGVVSFRAFRAGDLVAKMAGETLSYVTQHTLQITPQTHFLDLFFTGYLLHSCEPNVSLDMQALTMTALRDIAPNDLLTMDYAQTEDFLYRQFPCSCGARSCRGWITGRKEPVDEIARRKFQQEQRSEKAQRAG